jgi:hypothetical protein
VDTTSERGGYLLTRVRPRADLLRPRTKKLLHPCVSKVLRRHIMRNEPDLLHEQRGSTILFGAGRHLLRQYLMWAGSNLLHEQRGSKILFGVGRPLLRQHFLCAGPDVL